MGGERTDYFSDVVVRRSDLALVAVGSSMSRSAGRKDAWIAAFDPEGSALWEHNLGGALDEEFTAVIDREDGSVVAAGFSASGASGGTAGTVFAFAHDGTRLWEYRIDDGAAEQFSAITALDNGDVVVGGSAGNSAALLVRLTPDGQEVWRNVYREGVPQQISALLPQANGDVVAAGQSTTLFDSDGVLARISADGETRWHRSTGDSGNDRLSAVEMMPDGSLIAVGETERNANLQGWLTRWSANGELLWEKPVGGTGRDSLHAVAMRANFALVAVGTQDADNRAQPNAWLLEFSEDGSVIQSRTFGGEFSEGFAAMSPRADGSLAVAGFRQSLQGAPSSGYTAVVGTEVQRVVMRGGNERVAAPVVFVPGEGRVLTDSPSVEVLGNIIHNRPITRLFVDGIPASTMHNGAFAARVTVPLGTTRIKVDAIDTQGVAGSAEVTVTRVAANSLGTESLLALRNQVNFGNYHAVVIGNNAYDGDLPALATAENDARAVAETLTDEYGFDVELLINASHDRIVSVIEQQASALREDDNLLIYYAGHGYYDEDTDVGYWLPVDAGLSSKNNWIRNSTITDSIKSMQAKHVMLVADSCFSGTLLRSANVRRGGRFYEEMATRTARLVMTSGGVEPVMDGGGDGHSVFARNFLDKLRSGEEIIDGTSLYQAIREPVVLSSQQVPQYANIRFIQSDGGDFLFVKSQP